MIESQINVNICDQIIDFFQMKQNVMRILCGLIIALILSEVILGLLDIPKFYKAHSSPPQFQFSSLENGELFYTNLPSEHIIFEYDGNPRGYFDDNNRVFQTTNAQGFRGHDFNQLKPENTTRIAFLGDSFTFGEGVKDDDIFTKRIEDKLNESGKSMNYECLNFGVGGYNTKLSVDLLKHVVIKYSPDIVILGYTLNDVEPELFYYDKYSNSIKRKPRERYIPEGLPSRTPPHSILYILRLTTLMWQAVHNRNVSDHTVKYYQMLFDQEFLWNNNKDSLNEFIGLCTVNKIKCYVAIFPLLYRLQDQYPFSNLHKKVTEAISDENIAIDLLPDFIGRQDTDLWVHPTDQHPNEIAHDIIAQSICAVLLGDLAKNASTTK